MMTSAFLINYRLEGRWEAVILVTGDGQASLNWSGISLKAGHSIA